ncbi:hypothetical protein M885DRAFT_613290 [Pelagophyceae sp. CCMP2097]|nr:hypothetical protein M885DRAFT_613290 [Pelagophyceae sp. CCMP2097]
MASVLAPPRIEHLQVRSEDGSVRDVDALVDAWPKGESLRAALRGAALVFASPKAVPPNADLARRRTYLARKAEERAYAKMTGNVHEKPHSAEDSMGKSLRFQASVGVNMIVAPVAMFFVAYIAARNLVASQRWRVVLGLGAAIVMLFIEMTLYIARSLAVERDASKRKSKKRR